MDVFSLEDDDCNDLFITQTPREDVGNGKESCGNDGNIVTLPMGNVTNLHASKVNSDDSGLQMYSDISDPEDDFVNPIYGRTNR